MTDRMLLLMSNILSYEHVLSIILVKISDYQSQRQVNLWVQRQPGLPSEPVPKQNKEQP